MPGANTGEARRAQHHEKEEARQEEACEPQRYPSNAFCTEKPNRHNLAVEHCGVTGFVVFCDPVIADSEQEVEVSFYYLVFRRKKDGAAPRRKRFQGEDTSLRRAVACAKV